MKIKRAGTQSAHVVLILDESSSMYSCYDETIASVNQFIERQRTSRISTLLTLVTFNGGSVRTVIDRVPAQVVEPITKQSYQPSGFTNLLDAIGHTVEQINQQLVPFKREHRPSIEICIITDGEENMSRKYTVAQIRELKQQCEHKDWTFTFVGANIDAFSEGSKLGFGRAQTYQFDTTQIGSTMNAMASRTEQIKQLRASGISGQSVYSQAELTPEERDSLQ